MHTVGPGTFPCIVLPKSWVLDEPSSTGHTVLVRRQIKGCSRRLSDLKSEAS
jgi:hypothetical protein